MQFQTIRDVTKFHRRYKVQTKQLTKQKMKSCLCNRRAVMWSEEISTFSSDTRVDNLPTDEHAHR